MTTDGNSSNVRFLVGDGEMARLMRAHDWASTSLGPPEIWPQALRTCTRLMLNTRHPVFIFWGPEAICLYNDGYYALIGPERHSIALGNPGAIVWDEIWDVIGPQVKQVMAGDEATWYENHLIPVTRNGRKEEAYWTYSYSPIDDETAPYGVGGTLVLVSETTQAVLAQQQQAKQTERFVALFDQAPTFMAVLGGPEHMIEFTNPGYQELVENRDVIGMTVKDALPEAVEQGFLDLLDNVYQTGEPFRGWGVPYVPPTSKGKDDNKRYLDLLYQPIRGADGVINGILAVGVDVTERMLVVNALSESETRLRLATDAAGVGLWDYNFEGEYIFWQPAVKAMFGMPLDVEVTREDLLAAVHPDDRERVIAALAATRDPNIRADYDEEYRAIGKSDGVQRWVASKGRAFFNDDGECIRIIGTALDITARKQNEERLQALNLELERQVIERTQARGMTWQISPDLLGALNMQGYFETSNPAWKTVLGWSEEEVAGMSIFELLHPDDVERTRIGFELTHIGQPAIRFPNRYRCKDGSYRWISWVGVFEDGYTYCSGRDITEVVEQEEQLKVAEDALRQSQKMEAVGQLTGGIAHDFNNMLAVVMGSLDLLKRRMATDDSAGQRYVTAALEASKRAAGLTHRLLAFSRQQPLQPETLDANKLVSNMSDLLHHSLGPEIRLETVLAAGVWRIHVDPNQLENAILNLAVNARDAMEGGGKLTIETQNAHLDSRYVSANLGIPSGQYVLLAITDTGVGMAPDVITKAFDPFFTTKDVGKGTGLGLSQVYGFVKQSGGHIKIYSEVEQGTSIKIYLPRAKDVIDDAASNQQTGLDLPKGDGREVILVVDDEPAVRQFSADALTELGYRVLEAGSADAALVILQAHPEIALLFTDIVMPEVSGRKLADQAQKLRPDLKVLYTTGYTRNAVVHNGVVDKGVELIGKPYTLDELAMRVRDILDAPPRL